MNRFTKFLTYKLLEIILYCSCVLIFFDKSDLDPIPAINVNSFSIVDYFWAPKVNGKTKQIFFFEILIPIFYFYNPFIHENKRYNNLCKEIKVLIQVLVLACPTLQECMDMTRNKKIIFILDFPLIKVILYFPYWSFLTTKKALQILLK